MAPTRAKLTPNDKNKIVGYWRNGYTDRKIMEKLAVGHNAFYKFIKKCGIKRHSNIQGKVDEMIDLIRDLQASNKQTWGFTMVNAALNQRGCYYKIYLI